MMDNTASRTRRFILAIGGASLIVILLAIFWKQAMLFFFHDLPFMGEAFDKSAWSSAFTCHGEKECLEKEMACPRGGMFRDLTQTHLIPGTSAAKVAGLLGNPDRKTTSGCYVYELGYCSGLRIDLDYLNVCFDSEEKVTHISHWQS